MNDTAPKPRPRYKTKPIKARHILPGNMIVTAAGNLNGVKSVSPCQAHRTNVHIITTNGTDGCYYGDTFLVIKNP